MRRLYYSCSLLLLLFALPAHADAGLQIVATIPPLAQIAQAVCGDDGEVHTLAKIAQDPHFVPPKPTLARHLADADLLFSVGLALESGWLPPLIELSRNPAVRVGGAGYFAGSDYIDVIGGDRKVDRSMGDVHPEGNPHWWLDPLRVAQVAKALALRLGQLDTDHAAAYVARANHFEALIQQRMGQWRLKAAGMKPVVTYHDSYRYFVDRFAIKVVAFVEPKPGVEPSTRHLDGLVKQLQGGGIAAVWFEPYHDNVIVQRVCEFAQLPCSVMPDSVEGEGTDGYLSLIDRLFNGGQ